MSTRLLTIVLTGILCCGNSCNNKKEVKNGYLITGKITNYPSRQIFLEELTPAQRIVIDTATIKEDGSFAMEGHVPEPGFYNLRLDAQRQISLVVENRHIDIQIDGNDFNNYQISGSNDSKVIQDLMNSVFQTQSTAQNLQKELQQRLYAEQDKSKHSLIRSEVQQEYNRLIEKQTNKLKIFIDTSSSITAIFAAKLLNPEQEMAYLNAISEIFQQKFPNSKQTKYFVDRIANLKRLAIGEKVPDIRLASPDGDILALSSLRGKVVLLDFWAAWCRPCRQENPRVVRLYKQYKDKGFDVYSVSLDNNRNHWLTAIQQDNLIWKNHVSELKGWQSSITKTFKVTSIPKTFLIDREGVLIGKNIRGEALALKLQELFN